MYKIYNEATNQSFTIYCENMENARSICDKLNSYQDTGFWDCKVSF